MYCEILKQCRISVIFKIKRELFLILLQITLLMYFCLLIKIFLFIHGAIKINIPYQFYDFYEHPVVCTSRH